MTKTKKQVYPSKKTLNLCFKEKPQIDPLKATPLVILVLILAVVFAKFAVVDRLVALNTAQNRINAAQKRVDDLTELTADYDAVSLEYAKYSTNWMSDEERYLVTRTDMTALINEELMNSSSSVRSISMSGNKISVELNNASLESTSSLVSKLNSRDDVSSVAVYSAKSETGTSNVVSVVITMLYQEEAE